MSFIQLKRKIDDDPKEILILASKKKKIENLKENAKIYELAITAAQREDISNLIDKKITDIRELKVRKFDIEKITNHLRIEHLQRTKHNRLQILNCKRNISCESDVESSLPVIDLSNDDENGPENMQDDNYVYDIYYSKNGIDVNDPDVIQNYAVHEVDKCIWQENLNSDEESNGMEDDDDSNDENNWRNDYPDEEDYGLDSNDEDDYDYMTRKLKNSHLSDNSLSSDDFDEAINDNLFNLHRKHKSKKNDDIDYYDEVASDESEQSEIL